MILEQHYLACLSQASYLVGDERTGRAVVVDPHRDVSEYLDSARDHGLRIERVIETHFHADFLSGHLELAAETGATICYGEPAEADFPIERLRDGERITLGDVVLEVRSTPGHTPESISIVVYEHDGDTEPYAVLTGDTLFIGDVGRPDLLVSAGITADSLARDLYRSLHRRLLTLPDATRVYPAHGAGSACGKSLSSATWSTIGEQRATNHALAAMSEDEFVDLVTEGQPTSPLYFPYNARRNREAHPLFHEEEAPRALDLEEALALQRGGAVVLDTREAADFAAGHLRGAVNVGLQGRFAEYAGDLLRPDQPIVLFSDPGTEAEARTRLARIGFDAVAGALADPLRVLVDRPDLARSSSRLTVAQLEEAMATSSPQIVDVRNKAELEGGTITGALHIPLARLLERMDELDRERPVVTYCAGGYRSIMAASRLELAGFADASDLLGGFAAWQRGAGVA